VRIEDGLELEPNRWGQVEIPGCGRDDLPQFFADRGYKVGVEIGVYKGVFTRQFCEAGLKVYGVDPWKVYGDYHSHRKQARQDFLYEHAMRYLKDYDCTIIRKTSMEAVEDFEDGSIDWVYIDGNHQLRYVIEDIVEWSKKVRTGGVVSGHDYAETVNNPHSANVLQAKYAVDAYVRAYRIRPWFILGRRRAPKGEYRDKWRSWMWLKP